MAITAADVEEFIALIQRDPGLRERVRQALIEDAFERIAATMAHSAEEDRAFRTEMREFQTETREFQREMREFQTETREFRTEMGEFQTEMRDFQTETREFQTEMGEFQTEMREFQTEMVEFRTRTDERFGGVERRLDRLEGQFGNFRGEIYEMRFLANPARLARQFREVYPLMPGNYEPIAAALDKGAISEDDWDELLRADAFARVRRRGDPTESVAVVELSRVIDQGDVERARRRASILSIAGVPAVPCVVGEAATAGAVASAARDVVLFLDRKDPAEPIATA